MTTGDRTVLGLTFLASLFAALVIGADTWVVQSSCKYLTPLPNHPSALQCSSKPDNGGLPRCPVAIRADVARAKAEVEAVGGTYKPDCRP